MSKDKLPENLLLCCKSTIVCFYTQRLLIRNGKNVLRSSNIFFWSNWSRLNFSEIQDLPLFLRLSTCAQLERGNISFRLQSGRKQYIEKGGKLGRKAGSVKTEEQIRTEYRDVISLLRKGYSIRDVAKLNGKGISTVQRVKRLLKVQSSQ